MDTLKNNQGSVSHVGQMVPNSWALKGPHEGASGLLLWRALHDQPQVRDTPPLCLLPFQLTL